MICCVACERLLQFKDGNSDQFVRRKYSGPELRRGCQVVFWLLLPLQQGLLGEKPRDVVVFFGATQNS